MKKLDLNILKPIDDFTFKKAEELQAHPEIQKLMDNYAALDERVQDLVKNIIALCIVLIPILFIMTLWSFNSSLKDTLELKKETLSIAQEIVAKEAKVGVVKRKFINSTPIKTQSEFQNKVSSILSSSGIDSTKIALGGFDTVDLDALIMESRVDLKFSQLSNSELFTMINNMNMRLKVKIDEISIKKNTTNNLLEGIIRVIYYGQDSDLGNNGL